jgi:hypothetical protein
MHPFPANPTDGMIFEVERGLFFVYSQASRSWNRLDGDRNPTLATPFAPGLMADVDLNKLNRLILPPISTSLRAGGYEDIVFDSGIINMSGGIESTTDAVVVNVDGKASLMNPAASIDRNNAEVVDRILHLDSNTFDFFIDIDEMRRVLQELGSIKVVLRQGPTGLRGDSGDRGSDRLHRGPDGAKGATGKNVPIVANLTNDPVKFEPADGDTEFRGVVQLSTEEVSPEENYLVVTRASIGDPDASPHQVRLGSIPDGNWLVVAAIQDPDSVRRIKGDKCEQRAGEMHYLDIEPLLASIRSEFELEADNLKRGMQRVANWWLTLMSAMFDEQKGALCCALEYCRSQTRNAETRKYIEQSRLHAARNQASIVLDPDPRNSGLCDVAVTPMAPACGDGFGTQNRKKTPNNSWPIGASHAVPVVTIIDGIPYQFRDVPPGMTPRGVVDHTDPLPVSQCTPKTLGTYTTNSTTPVWDLTPFHGQQQPTGHAGYWRIIEMGFCYPGGHPWYASGCILNHTLLNLPANFTSHYAYDGHLELQIGCLVNSKIHWPGTCQAETPPFSCSPPAPPPVPHPAGDPAFAAATADFSLCVAEIGAAACSTASTFQHGGTVLVKAMSAQGQHGGLSTQGIGDTRFPGGDGRGTSPGHGGGGGAAAGPSGPGASAQGPVGAVAASDAGSGGDGSVGPSAPQNGSWPGGGAGGPGATGPHTSVGGWGRVRVSYRDANGNTVISDLNVPGSATFTKPAGIGSIFVECWGAGDSTASSGGGGGAYSSRVISSL